MIDGLGDQSEMDVVVPLESRRALATACFDLHKMNLLRDAEELDVDTKPVSAVAIAQLPYRACLRLRASQCNTIHFADIASFGFSPDRACITG